MQWQTINTTSINSTKNKSVCKMKNEQAVHTKLSNQTTEKNAKFSYTAPRNVSCFLAEKTYIFYGCNFNIHRKLSLKPALLKMPNRVLSLLPSEDEDKFIFQNNGGLFSLLRSTSKISVTTKKQSSNFYSTVLLNSLTSWMPQTHYEEQ